MKQFTGLSITAIVLGSLTLPAAGQIVGDRTLPNSSQVQPAGNTLVIRGGTQRGTNLFHSFETFSVPQGRTASFQDFSPQVAHIFARITGNTASQIDGRLQVLSSDGAVNLLLLNPNGIVFGPNSSLNVPGSFLAATGDRVLFQDGVQFSASAPQADPLLTVSVPVGLQFGRRPGNIVNRSGANDFESPGLQVPEGRSLLLLGGSLAMDGAITAEEGRVALGSVGAGQQVALQTLGNNWVVDLGTVQSLGNIDLFAGALVDVSGDAGGTVRLWGDRISLIEDAQILADTEDRPGGGMVIQANRLILDNALLGATSFGEGRGGNITLQTGELRMRNAAQIEANADGNGTGGTIAIRANTIDLGGLVQLIDGLKASGIFARVNPDATGDGGDITLWTNQLRILEGAQIGLETFGQGNAGTLTVNATDIELAGIGRSPTGTPFLVRGVPLPSALSAFTLPGSSGRGGAIAINTQRLTLRDGAVIQATTQSQGDAGNIRVTASESVLLDGTAVGLFAPTSLLTFSGGIPGTPFVGQPGSPATGRGGNLTLNTPLLTVQNGALIATGSNNPSRDVVAGNVQITADQMRLLNLANLQASTNSGNGGNVSLQVNQLLLLRSGSNLSTSAGTAQQGGNGGNMVLNARLIAAVANEDSNIQADAFRGRGGNIDIITDGIFGIQFRASATDFSDITASSRFGLQGNVSINGVDIDPSQGLAELPANIVDAASQIARACPGASGSIAAQEGDRNAFFITGRGGLPADPTQTLNTTPNVAWVTVPSQIASAKVEPPDPLAADEMPMEAEGWAIDPNGIVRLLGRSVSVGFAGGSCGV